VRRRRRLRRELSLLRRQDLEVEPLRVLASTGMSGTITDVPSVINARTFAKACGSTTRRSASAFRSGGFPPMLVIASQSRRP
jgi:hypothetical protein